MDINIEEIRVIIKKKERGEFYFRNRGKQEDGFVLFTEGRVQYTRKGHAPIFLKSGDLVLLKRGDEYEFFSSGPCTYITAAFFFSPDSEEAQSQLPPVLSAPKEVQNKIEEAEAVRQLRRWDHSIATRILLLETYRELLRRTRSGVGPAEKIVAAAKEYLHLHFKENFSTAQIAAHCGVSPSHLRAVFGKETGMSITEFRNLLRINTAKEMLTSNLFTVRQTAEALGYCDVYYFSKSFRQVTGIAPARFRNRETDT
ncbi:MAG: helix-turn-helix transcriptional regulator [Clostridia bacterium]|nr:helix-turn-helix transcriptional regulator [Clostridia bacterium]